MLEMRARKDAQRTGEVDLAHEIVHLPGETSPREQVGQGVDTVDDFWDVLAVIQVDRLEAKDLARRKIRNGQPR